MRWNGTEQFKEPKRLQKENEGTDRLNVLEAGREALQHLWMTKYSPFRYFKMSSDIIRLAVMLYVLFPLYLRNVKDLSLDWFGSFLFLKNYLGPHTIRISTGKRDLDDAKKYARDLSLEQKIRHKNDLPLVTKKFFDVAKLAIVDMRNQLEAGLGRKVFADGFAFLAP